MKNRLATAAISVIAICVVLAGCAGSAGDDENPDAGGSDSQGTIKVANIMTSSGALAANADTVRQTWQYAIDEVNEAGGAGGYDFEFVEMDTDASPAASVRAATQAVTQEGASILVSFQTSPENAAVNPQLAALNALSINTVAQDDGLRGASCSPNAFNIVQSNSMLFNTLAGQIDDFDGEKWAIMSVDYSVGHGGADAFAAAAEESGKEIVSQQFAPLNTTDYGSYITEIQRSGADALLLIMYGPDAEAFVNQAEQYDLASQIDTTLTLNVITDQSFESLGDKVLGDYLIKQYDAAADNELNQSFVDGYTESFGTPPNDYAGNAYIGAQALFAAVAEAESDDPEAIRSALSGMTFDSIAGSVEIRADDHQALTPTYLAQVVEGDDGLAFEVLSTIPGEESAPEPSSECTL
ncbi:ABC transporter substrate-binding protein [Microbacterium pygmaeum]|uniref:Amino acid/amide ABC transporter substrate-binding protein, HAAT family n=1 Tax=Microbacterium pygmaeum TaxID=370764 RepID=A0A1G7XCW7_9MICO|nr:ABC transporter substrate-binding protein [Microbacterium pygmaeum]SDG82029.1 amino acid/amide ABC transporter substrate-binding protein, HAAT family [Microbacterium pygmaeum]